MKIIRRIGIIAAVLLGLFMLAIVALFLLVDPNLFKGDITRVVKESQQRTLKIDGDLHLTLFPRLGLDLGKLSLSAYKSEAPFASMQSAHVSVALIPLLQKHLLVDRIRITGLEAMLTRDQDGRTNVDDLLESQPDHESKESEPARQEAGTVNFDVAGFELNNSKLVLHDAITKTDATFKNILIKTGRIADRVPTKINIQAEIEAVQPAVKATLVIQAEALFDRQAHQYGLNYLDSHLDGEVPGINGLKLTLNAVKLSQAPGQIVADSLKLRVTGQRNGNPFEAKFDAPSLSLSDNLAKGVALSGAFRLGGAHKLDVQFDASAVEGKADALHIDKLALNLNAREGAQAITARIETPLKGNLEARTFELPTVTADIVLNGPADATIHLNGDLQADMHQELIASAWEGRIDGSKMTAQLGLTRFSEPSLRFDLGLDQINFDRYFAGPGPASGQAARPASEPGKATLGSKPIDLSALKALSGQTSANGTLRIASLQAQNIKAQSVVVGVHGGNERIDLAPLSARLYRGDLSGSASISASNRFTFKQFLTGVSINPLMRDVLNRDVLEGTGDVVLDLATTGNSVDALKRGLNGTTRIQLRDGAIKGFNLAQSLRDFKSKIGIKVDETQTTNSHDKTDFSELSASFNLNKGVASNNDLTMKSPFLRVGGFGTIDLGEERIDYLAKATVVNTSGGQGGKELAQLSDLTIPVRLGGNFTQPTYRIEWSSIASKALENKLKDKLGEKLFGKSAESNADQTTNKNPKDQIKDQLKDKLQDKLKGLLGR